MTSWFGVQSLILPRYLVLILAFVATTAQAQIVAPPSSGTVIVNGTTVTATGDLSPGLDINGPTVDTLLINSLNQNLGNTGTADAVNFSTLNSNLSITMDLGVFQGSASGLLADVIDATVTGDGNITIDSTGELTAGLANGILGNVTGNGNVIITSQGNITTRGLGINGLVGDSGNVSIRSTGNITVTPPVPVFPSPPTRPAGIRAAITNAGQVEVISMGDITVNGGSIASGIQVNEFLGLVTPRSVSIVSIGNISASGGTNSFGIQAGHDIGPIQITSTGDIIAETGISAFLGTSGDVTVSSTGNISGQSGGGIFANTPSGVVQLTIDGGVVRGTDGILSNSPIGGTMISILPGGTVQGTGAGGTDRGIDITSGATQVMVAGSVIGGGGGAIQFAPGNFNDALELRPGFGMTGIVRADSGTDTLRFGGSGNGNFDLSSIDTGGNTQQYREFEVFEVNSGTWSFSNGTAAAFTANGGVVTGNASFGGLIVNSGATIAPGNGVGTMTVNGNAAFNPGSNLALDLRPDGSGDLLNVTGTTTISGNGTSLNATVNPLTTLTASTWTAITSTGGVTGEFATVADNLPDLDLQAIYHPDSVQLTLVPTTADSDPSAFSRKEIHPSAQMAALDVSLLFVETLRRRGGLHSAMKSASSDLSAEFLPQPETNPWQTTVPCGAYEAYEPEWSFWSAFLGSDTSIEGDGGIPGWDSTKAGFAFGFENQGPSSFHFPGRVGFSAGYLSTDVATDASDAEIESWHLGVYATTQAGPLLLSGAASYAHLDYEFDRFVSLGNGAVIAHGDADGNSVSGSFEAFLDLARGDKEGIRFGPLATVGMVYGDREEFSETGAGFLNLQVDADEGFQTITGLGLAIGVDRNLGQIPVTIDARVLWEHVFDDTSVTTTSTIPFAGGAFSASSAGIERNRASVGLGSALQLSEDVSAHLRYDGTFFDSSEDHRGSVGITVKF